jgi:hypothetical protein
VLKSITIIIGKVTFMKTKNKWQTPGHMVWHSYIQERQ